MRKKFLSVFLIFCMVLTLLPTAALATGEEGETAVVQQTDGGSGDDTSGETSTDVVVEVNGTAYATLADAVTAIAGVDTANVKLLSNIELNDTLTIAAGKTVVLDLNSFTLVEKGSGARKIVNNGTLTVKGGTLKNADQGSYGLIDNYGTLTVESGTFVDVGRGSGASIKNRPGATQLTILDGTFQSTADDSDGGNLNNYETASNAIVASEAPLTISGGMFSSVAWYTPAIKIMDGSAYISDISMTTKRAGGIESAGSEDVVIENANVTVISENSYYANAIAVSNGGVVTVKSGTYTGYKYGVYIYNSGGTINIEGSTFKAETALKADKSIYDTQPSIINVSGGDFTGNYNIQEGATLTITGGTFSSNPSAYVPTVGYEVTGGESGPYTVKTKTGMDVSVTPPSSGQTNVGAAVDGNYSTTEGDNADEVGTEGSSIIIDVTTGEGEGPVVNNSVTKTEVELGGNALTSVQKNTSVSNVAIATDVGTVTLDKTAWDTITENATIGEVTAPVTLTITANKAESTVTGWTVTATAGSEPVFNKDRANGEITITVTNPLAEATDKTVKVYYVGEDGSIEDMNATTTDDGRLTWTTTHLSTFVPVAVSTNDEAVWTDDDGVARTGTLADAIKGANKIKDGGTIQLLRDVPNAAGITVPGRTNFTLDFNNFTYTLNVPGAGSTGTETNGFQLLRDSTITFKSGTINISPDNLSGGDTERKPIMRMIQNYANLTLENMTFNAKNQYGGEDYALSFNYGDIEFKGDTDVITSSDDVIAFDVCRWTGGGYDDVSVTFAEDYTGTVNGKILYESDDGTKGTLKIEGKGGTFGAIVPKSGSENAAKQGIEVSGGSFAAPLLKEYLAEGLYYQAKNSAGVYTYHQTLKEAEVAAGPTGTVSEMVTEGTQTWTITFDSNGGSAIAMRVVANGSSIGTLPVPTRSGYTFQYWYDETGSAVESSYNVTKNITLTARWSYNGGSSSGGGGGSGSSTPTYQVSVDKAEGGKITVSPTRAEKGETVTITVKPDEGYELGKLTVTDKDGDKVTLTQKDDNKYTFKMPAGKVTVKATFTEIEVEPEQPELPFSDVAEQDWFYDAVVYVYENELMNGTSATTFSPSVTTSRAMMLTMLARYDGVDTSTGSTWYEAGAAWAVAEGVSDGTNLEADLTREQLVTMLWRYAGSPMVEKDLPDYPDRDEVSDWAVRAMVWAVDNGIITGNGAGELNPQGSASRAEVATILMRFIEL